MIDANVLKEDAVSPFPPAQTEDVGSSAIKVRAIKQGFHQVVRRVGDVFTMPAGSKGSWFVPVEKPAAAKAKGNVLNDADLA